MGFYDTAAWRAARRQALHDFGHRCSSCGASLVGKGKGAHVHHRKPLGKAPALAIEPQNLRPVCVACHNRIEPRALIDGISSSARERARPKLPNPNCRVVLVCGPVAAGKSTYVAERLRPGDQMIDFDSIARELGVHRRHHRPTASILIERNRRMAALAHAPKDMIAFVIMTAPAPVLRQWWCASLNVAPDDCVLLVPDRAELQRRIDADPDRRVCRDQQLRLVAQWFERERTNYAPFVLPECSLIGDPVDPFHPWNAHQSA